MTVILLLLRKYNYTNISLSNMDYIRIKNKLTDKTTSLQVFYQFD